MPLEHHESWPVAACSSPSWPSMSNPFGSRSRFGLAKLLRTSNEASEMSILPIALRSSICFRVRVCFTRGGADRSAAAPLPANLRNGLARLVARKLRVPGCRRRRRRRFPGSLYDATCRCLKRLRSNARAPHGDGDAGVHELRGSDQGRCASGDAGFDRATHGRCVLLGHERCAAAAALPSLLAEIAPPLRTVPVTACAPPSTKSPPRTALSRRSFQRPPSDQEAYFCSRPITHVERAFALVGNGGDVAVTLSGAADRSATPASARSVGPWRRSDRLPTCALLAWNALIAAIVLARTSVHRGCRAPLARHARRGCVLATVPDRSAERGRAPP